MLVRIANKLRKLGKDTGGNAVLLVAVGVPMLIGGAGAAVDIAQWYSWKRELQQAADQGALAAAWALSNSSMRDNYRTRGQQDYQNNLALTRDFASAASFRLANYSNGSNNSVVATASASRSLPFSGFLTGNAVTVSVSSQASFRAGANYSACLIAVGDSGTTFSVGGNANVQARCGLAALSCSDDAIVIDGSATVVTDSIATCGTASVPSANESVLTENATGLVDSFADLTPPTNNTTRSYACTGTGQNKQASPLAGTYAGGLTVRCRTTFGAGIYVINGGTLDLTGNYTVTGSNVMFVLKNGATLKLGGSGNNNTLSLTPMQASNFIALGYSTTLANRYANMLIFEDRTSNPTQDHIINGNSTSLFQGTIYLPKGTARLNGTSSISSTCLQISARNINILGNAYLDTRCTTSQTNSAGHSAARVLLVA
ncbi:pilus assembly protein TadG-related protein [Novosphingobium sp.]|uniref:pilus assembly protein TadG-related protein n=1 Tax=Novosphingobium sp. TaxID=1874826 RepID=UPI0025FCB946|nr:pilus assembly protein TadG-related protein [Novosphingobium sp.]MCC6925561.1 pilus assembly protein [Novosphingobium sp.]